MCITHFNALVDKYDVFSSVLMFSSTTCTCLTHSYRDFLDLDFSITFGVIIMFIHNYVCYVDIFDCGRSLILNPKPLRVNVIWFYVLSLDTYSINSTSVEIVATLGFTYILIQILPKYHNKKSPIYLLIIMQVEWGAYR